MQILPVMSDLHALGLIIYLISNVIISRFFRIKIKIFMILSILFLYFLFPI